jgi:hypothetical protein
VSNPYAAPPRSTATAAPGARARVIALVIVVALLVVGGIGAAVWALVTSSPGASVLDVAGLAAGDEEGDLTAAHDEVGEPWRRGDLTQGVDGGTFQDPWPIDGPVATSLWTVELSDARPATDEILAADPGNTRPYGTNEYRMVHVEATYTGPDQEITPSTTVQVSYYADAGTGYTMTCGTVPDEFDATGLLTTGTVISGNVCVSLPAQTPGSWNVSQSTAGFVFLRAP